jgi:hypothetical protein
MKTWMAIAALTLLLVQPLTAAISVGSGETRLTFDTYPATNEWRTLTVAGTPESISTPAEMDAAVQGLSAASISVPLLHVSENPPGPFTHGQWSSTGKYLFTRMGNNRYAPLLGIFRNDTGAFLQRVEISYDLNYGPSNFVSEETLFAYRAYYSLSGATNSWLPIHNLNVGATGRVAAVIDSWPGGAWFAGAELYIIWTDDNGPQFDPYYTFDNLVVSIRPRLSVERKPDGSVEVSWTEGWSGTLESTGNLTVLDWQPVPEPIQISGGRVRVIVWPTGPRFFRWTSSNI